MMRRLKKQSYYGQLNIGNKEILWDFMHFKWAIMFLPIKRMIENRIYFKSFFTIFVNSGVYLRNK